MTTWSRFHSRVKDWSSRPSNLEQKLTFYLPFLTSPFLQFLSILGDVKYAILIGGLHIEHKAHFICGSGWGWMMSEAGVFTSGKAVSTLDDHHIKRTRYDHQVLLVALSLLQQWAYLWSQSKTDLLEEWFDKQSGEGFMCKYCSLIIEVEVFICRLCTLWEMVI